jgi:hypothetical protein
VRRRLRSEPSPATLLAGAALVGWGDLFTYGMYSPMSLRLVGWGCVLLAVGAVAGSGRIDPSLDVVWVALGALIVWQGITLARNTTYYGAGHWLRDARYLSIALPTLAAAAVAAPARRALWPLVVVAFGLGGLFAIWSSPHPAIDVWYLLQHGTSCVVNGCNLYTMHTPRSPGVTEGFNYLPATAVLLVPFNTLVHDVRYGELAAIVAAAVVLARMTRGATPNVVPLFLCVPGLFFAVEQAWTESLLVLLLVGATAAADRRAPGRRNRLGAAILLGLALATKQHVWLLLPVAAITLGLRTTAIGIGTGLACILPWFVAGPNAFWQGTVTMFTGIAPRIDATTLWLHEPAGWQTALAVIVLAACYLVAWLTCRGHVDRFLLGAGIVLAGFDLMNKQSFFNQWMLVTWLMIAAVAIELRRGTMSVRVTDRALPGGG